jgi:hypothetical protein
MAEKKFAAQGIGITAGIKFSPSEMAQLDQVTAETEQLITLYNKNQSIDKTFKIKDTNVRTNWAGSYEVPSRTNPGQMHRKNITPRPDLPRMSTRDVNVHIIPISKAYAEGMKNARGWAAHNGDIYMVLDYFVKNGKFSKQDFKSVLTHELAHVKDPALKQSAKLYKTYNPNAGKPHARVVMQVAGLNQLLHPGIEAGNAGAPGHGCGITLRRRLQASRDTRTILRPYCGALRQPALPIAPPEHFLDEFFGHLRAMGGDGGGHYLLFRDQAMSDIGGKRRDRKSVG